ncbi:MAG: SCO family protein [Rhodothermales bacterium]|nr:SCO family protein [Rhodothermales bacterium]
MKFSIYILAPLLLTVIATEGVRAQSSMQIQSEQLLSGVGFDEKPGSIMDLDAPFVDHNGQAVTLRDYLQDERPVILNFAYYNCPVICSVMLDQMAVSMSEVGLDLGADYEVVTVSFSADEGYTLAATSREGFRPKVDDRENGWQFLTGSDESITALAESAGFRFKWIEENGEYAHPAALIFLSDEGKITRYLHGLQYPASNVRLALLEAAEGRIGTVWDQVVMYCFRFDPSSNSYVLQATNLMKLAGLITVIGIVFMLSFAWMRERRRQSAMHLAS